MSTTTRTRTDLHRTLFGNSRWEQFLKFYAENPQVYHLFRELAIKALSVTSGRIGGRLIWERIRWEYHFQVQGNHRPKLNDHHVPYYVRLLMHREPERFAQRFTIKNERFDGHIAQLRAACDRIDRSR